MLKEGDVIEIKKGHKVYAKVPEHFLYSNRRGSFKMDEGCVDVGGELDYLAGDYIVVKTAQFIDGYVQAADRRPYAAFVRGSDGLVDLVPLHALKVTINPTPTT